MIALALVALVAADLDDDARSDRAAAATDEAAAFAALDDGDNCRAARLFLRAASHVPDARLVENAALAFERHGDRHSALVAWRDALAPDDEHHRALRRALREQGSTPCATDILHHAVVRHAALDDAALNDSAAHTGPLVAPPAVDVAPEPAPTSATSPAQKDAPSWFAATALATGVGALFVASTTVGAWVWLEQGVLHDAHSSGDAKAAALAARAPVLVTGATVASALVVVTAAFLPWSFVSPGDTP